MAKKNDEDRNTIANQAEAARQALVGNLQQALKQDLNKKSPDLSAIEGARACLARADNGNLALRDLSTSLKRLSFELIGGEYERHVQQIDPDLFARALELGRITGVEFSGNGSPLKTIKKIEKEQHEVLRALVDEIDTKILSQNLQSKRRPKP